MSTIGELIAEKRKEKGLTQAGLAMMLGVSAMAVSKWERGLAAPDRAHRDQLVNLLGLEIEKESSIQTDSAADKTKREGFLSTIRLEHLRIPSTGVMLGICICRLLGTVSTDAAIVCIGLCGAVFCLATMLKAVR